MEGDEEKTFHCPPRTREGTVIGRIAPGAVARDHVPGAAQPSIVPMPATGSGEGVPPMRHAASRDTRLRQR